VRPRREVAVLLSRFPLITETFILREIIEMERQGQPVLLVPMIREQASVVHPEALPWMERALFTPWLSAAIAMANLRALVRKPLVYLRTLGELAIGMVRSPDFFVRTMALFPKSVYLAERLEERGIRHAHAHFATHPATMAMIINRFAPSITFSITVHAHDIFVNRVMLEPKLQSAAGVRAISRFNRSYLAALFPRVPIRKTEVIHVGIEPAAYAADAPVIATPPRILTVAALKPYKGIRILIEACALLRSRGVPFVCDIVGEGPLRRTLTALIERRGLEQQVHLCGAMPQGEVARMMRETSLFVLPSIVASDGQMEGIPVALMEAMAASRPVIASALSGIPELVEDDVTGLLVDPNNPEILAAAMQRLLGSPETARRLGVSARERVLAEFSLQETVTKLIDWLGTMNVPAPPVPEIGEDVTAVGMRESHVTQDSHVFRVLAVRDSSAEDLVVKEHRTREGESASAIERAAREAEFLNERSLRTATEGGVRLTVPALVRRKGATVVMRAARGTRLDEVVRRSRFGDLPHLEAAMDRAAAWLRWFHTPAADGSITIHGDFWPGNVFIAQDEVTAIDFEGVRTGDPLFDVAWFVVHLGMFFPPPLGARFRRARSRFLTSYFGSDIPAAALARHEQAVASSVRERLTKKGLRGRLVRMALARHHSGAAA